MLSIGEMLYFSADDGTNGRELWVSDGTNAETLIVKDIHEGIGDSSPIYLTEYKEDIYFSANNGIHGRELWRSDGTKSGTKMVGDIMLGAGSSCPIWFKEFDGKLFFTADDGVNGRELWYVRYFLAGDYEPDGDVDIDDLDCLRNEWLLEKLYADVAPNGGDGVVNFLDWVVFADAWQDTMDINDLTIFARQWLRLSANCTDINNNGSDNIVDMLEFAVMAENWLVGVE
jgi:ELWxxDGT repeat protein